MLLRGSTYTWQDEDMIEARSVVRLDLLGRFGN